MRKKQGLLIGLCLLAAASATACAKKPDPPMNETVVECPVKETVAAATTSDAKAAPETYGFEGKFDQFGEHVTQKDINTYHAFENDKVADEYKDAFDNYVRYLNGVEVENSEAELVDSGERYRIFEGDGYQYGYSVGETVDFYFQWTDDTVKEAVMNEVNAQMEEEMKQTKDLNEIRDKHVNDTFVNEIFRDVVLTESITITKYDEEMEEKEVTEKEVEKLKEMLHKTDLSEDGFVEYPTTKYIISFFDKYDNTIFQLETDMTDVWINERVVAHPELVQFLKGIIKEQWNEPDPDIIF